MALIPLYHGTDVLSANDILLNGLDAAKAASYNGGGEFWASADIRVADWFARTNPSGGKRRFSFLKLRKALCNEFWPRVQKLLLFTVRMIMNSCRHAFRF